MEYLYCIIQWLYQLAGLPSCHEHTRELCNVCTLIYKRALQELRGQNDHQRTEMPACTAAAVVDVAVDNFVHIYVETA